jgi:hypothetical protein
MRPKDLLIRTALDVRKYSAPHSGSPLMNPYTRTGGVGMSMWADWVPTFSIGGTALDPAHVTIYKCTYTIWGIMIFWQADFFINDSEGLSGDFTFSKPPHYAGFEGHGTGMLAETDYWQSITAKANGEFTYLIVQWWDGWVLFSTWHPDSCYISLQGMGVANP